MVDRFVYASVLRREEYNNYKVINSKSDQINMQFCNSALKWDVGGVFGYVEKM